ncbi:serine hydrolase domain-containing protein [Robiginitalea sp. IMCC44478]|uniref:serine hydrolase domain-containing protein n=1 Tax=Robiginitalea sp. IMCC44478 TaxID=3459122 RepID=UPI0040423C59
MACKRPNTVQSDTSAAKVELARVPDSVISVVDSVVKKLAIDNQCRMAVKAGKPGENVMYYGYDGRAGQTFDRFDIPFEIGSVSKMFTATAIMQLVEQGKVDLETPFTQILPADTLYNGLAYVEKDVDYIDSIKVKNLLNHSSGMPDYFLGSDDEEIENNGDRNLRFTVNDLIALSKSNSKERFKPGSKHEYCNINYIFLGQIIEKVSGQAYTDYVQQHILDRLGMEHTYFGTTNPPEEMETGHYMTVASEMPYTMAGPAGEIISTLDDMYIFIDNFYQGKLFESKETLDEVRSAHFHQMGMGMEYGLGVINIKNNSWGHGGQTFGFQSYAAATPSGYRFVMFIDDAGAQSVWMPAISFSNLFNGL